MSALTAHRSLAGRLRLELYNNICLLSLRRPMLEELARMLNGGPQTLDKLNQTLIIHLSYYFATIIDPKLAQLISWPLYDKASERAYKTQLMGFLAVFYTKNGAMEKDKWITPIQSSYLSAGGFKVMQLLFEMSQLALSKLIRTDFKLNEENLEGCDLSVYIKDKSKLDSAIVKSRKHFTEKSVNFATIKKQALTVSQIYKDLISELEIENANLQKSLEDCLIDTNISEKLKDAITEPNFLTEWNDYSDEKLANLEQNWIKLTEQLIQKCISCRKAGTSTVARSSHIDKSSYIIEYNPERDQINISDLETQVSSQQRYILKNIVKDGVLNFGYFLRGYTVAACFVFKNVQYLDNLMQLCSNVEEIKSGFVMLANKGKYLVDGLHSLELKFKESSSQLSYVDDSVIEVSIPPLPDLRIRDESWQNQLVTKPFTPLHSSKIQFNIKNQTIAEFRRPKSQFLAPNTISRPSILKNIAKLHTENLLFNSNNSLTSTSGQTRDMNKTVDCSAAFTKDQVLRLLSSKKSSSKKLKSRPESQKSHSKAKRGFLFRETPENSFTMARSVSSPNLFIPSETKAGRFSNMKIRNLYAITQEESPDRMSEMSGVAHLQSSTNSLPQNISLERNEEFKSMPAITVSKPVSKDSSFSSDNEIELKPVELNFQTPKSNVPLQKNNSKSLEKIIEKYRRIHSRISSINSTLVSPKLETINASVDKENDLNEINVDTNCTGHLPDLVSPNVISINKKTIANKSDWKDLESPVNEKTKCRESLGTVLGVDNSFLDQFDLVDE